MAKPMMSDEEPKPLESPVEKVVPPPDESPIPWPKFILEASEADIKRRVREELQQILKQSGLSAEYCFISLYDTYDRITSWDADRIYNGLQNENPDRKKNVFLFLVSRGGGH